MTTREDYLEQAKSMTKQSLEIAFTRLNMNEDYFKKRVEILDRKLETCEEAFVRLGTVFGDLK